MTFLVFSDLDGTLLDHETYDYESAREGLQILAMHHVPLVLVSSKTYAEMILLHDEMGLTAPFIYENGGGIYWPEGKKREPLGMGAAELRNKKNLVEGVIRESISFITDMSVDEIVNQTGLTRERALLAQQRSSSIPFIIPSGRKIMADDLELMNGALHSEGVSLTKGGRFYHLLSAAANKGSAVVKVIGHYRGRGEGPVTTVGIGDSENDIAMFKVVDIPVVVRKKDGTIIATGLDRVRSTVKAGPEGFSEAITSIILPD